MARRYANTILSVDDCGEVFGVFVTDKPYHTVMLPIVYRKDRRAAYRAASKRFRALANECERRLAALQGG